jgi:hypothetical protein
VTARANCEDNVPPSTFEQRVWRDLARERVRALADVAGESYSAAATEPFELSGWTSPHTRDVLRRVAPAVELTTRGSVRRDAQHSSPRSGGSARG